MSTTVATSAAAKAKPGLMPPASTGKRRLLWVASGILALLLCGLLALAFSLSSDETTTSTTITGSSATSMQGNASATTTVADTTASGDVVERLPGPPPREISGVAVDADGNSLDPNLTGPGDDSSFAKDDDKDGAAADTTQASAPH